MSPDQMLSANIQGRLLKLENLFDTIRNSSEQNKAALHSVIDPIHSEIKTIQSSLPKFDLGLGAIQSQVTAVSNSLGRNVSELSEKINQNLKEIGKSQESITLCHANNIGAKAILNSHDTRFEEHESKLRSLNGMIESQKKLYEELKKEIKQCAGCFESVSKSLTSIITRQDDMASRCAGYESKIQSLEISIPEIKQTTSKHYSELHHHLDKQISDLKAYVDQKLSAMPKPVEKPVYNPAQEILTELQGLRLDVQNAVLKNNNLDTQYKMQDKRIENLTLNLQKLQLSK